MLRERWERGLVPDAVVSAPRADGEPDGREPEWSVVIVTPVTKSNDRRAVSGGYCVILDSMRARIFK